MVSRRASAPCRSGIFGRSCPEKRSQSVLLGSPDEPNSLRNHRSDQQRAAFRRCWFVGASLSLGKGVVLKDSSSRRRAPMTVAVSGPLLQGGEELGGVRAVGSAVGAAYAVRRDLLASLLSRRNHQVGGKR